MYSVAFSQIISIVYIFIFSVVYFLKRKYNFLESKIYKLLLIFAGITLVFNIFNMVITSSSIFENVICMIVAKFYFVSLLFWLILFIAYVLLNNTNIKYNTLKELVKNNLVVKIYLIIDFLFLVLLTILPINYDDSIFYYYGYIDTEKYDIYEAARVDGANGIQCFTRITLPLVAKNVLTLCIPFTLWRLTSFDLVYAMTSGGPGEDTALIAYRITTEAFTNLNVGYAATLAVMLFLVMALFSFINMRFISKISD